MSVSDDVGNLFRRFGGDAGQYQEVARDDEAKQAALRWPLLNALDIAHTGPVPDAGRPAAPTAASGFRAEPGVASAAGQGEQPVRTAASSGSESSGPARLPLFARGHRHATTPPPVAPAQTGANRFSVPPAAAAERSNTAANAPSMAAAAAAPAVAPVAAIATPAMAPAPSVPPVTPASRVSAPQQEAQSAPPPSFLSKRQTFGPAVLARAVPESTRDVSRAPAQQQGGSILSGLFGGKATSSEAPAAAPSKDLSTLFARLSHGPAAPARSLRDTFRSRFKADGDA
ncbi:hypothetical protein G3N95_39985 [Paraburkholderia sp. Tr-20389]|uniref:cellulose biosynthesis protein BcsP n=1 Tax=Paraburkholderia sp. Tr-20389 TaxID=2703903 RepID=UPI00197F655D|nr:cellulose biosynthesis protein BcsP [Paraburkholderia sp. Tr-20389]MBN3759145.1 hypothetical protein [Paraburkholderia sp. Tr-20389]